MSISESNYPHGIKSVAVKLAAGSSVEVPATIIDLVNLVCSLVGVGDISNVTVKGNESPELASWKQAVAEGRTEQSLEDWSCY